MLVLSFSTSAVSSAQTKKSTSAEAFGRLPTFREVHLSPDGNKAASVRNIQGKMTIITQNLEPGHEREIYPLTYDEGKISYIQWLNNTRLLLTVKFQHESKKINRYRYRYIAIDWDKGNPINLVKGRFRIDKDSVHMVSTLYNDPDYVLMRMVQEPLNKGSNFTHDIFKVNIHTGDRKLVVTGPAKMYGGESGVSAVDHNGVVRLKIASHSDRYYLKYRKSEDQPFLNIHEFKPYYEAKEDRKAQKNDVFSHVSFTDDPNYIYVLSNHENGLTALYEFNVNDKSMRPTDVRDDKKGVWSVSIDPRTDKVIGYRLVGEKFQYNYLDKLFSKLKEDLTRLFPNEYIYFDSYTRDKDKFIFSVSSPTRPYEYYILDRKLNKITKFADDYPLVDKSTLSNMIRTSYTARDGLEIPAYLSLPKGKEDIKGLPTVILPHGGPNARDSWGFDYWVQFLTTQGYAVLQMNYRGSIGYGPELYYKGDREYGRGMLDDINDGAKWMISQGISDPDRICIMGASYGGYAALQAPVRAQKLYKCIVAMAPVTDMNRIKREEWYTADFYWDLMKDDSQSYSDISPYDQIDNIKPPILMVHGQQDNIVSSIHSEWMAERLKKKGKDFKFIAFEDGDHHLSLQKNRIKFLQEVEIFLKKHLE